MAMEWEPTASPLIGLIQQHMRSRGVDRRELGHRLAEGGNPAKAFRRLDQLLRGERFRPEVIQRVANALQIPTEQLAVAQEANESLETEKRAVTNRTRMEETMKRRGPHLWGLLPAGYHPSLITVLGAEFFLLVRLPDEVARLSHYEMIREVGEAVREHYKQHRRCRLVGYDYRRSLHEVFRFDVNGGYVRRVDGDPLDSRTFVRIGREAAKTPMDFIFRPSED